MRIRNDKVVVDTVERDIKDLQRMNLELSGRINDLDILLSELVSRFRAFAIASGLLYTVLVLELIHIVWR